eukprot:Filipodium_phascolosomae@DN4860_c0_g1_i1.p1
MLMGIPVKMYFVALVALVAIVAIVVSNMSVAVEGLSMQSNRHKVDTSYTAVPTRFLANPLPDQEAPVQHRPVWQSLQQREQSARPIVEKPKAKKGSRESRYELNPVTAEDANSIEQKQKYKKANFLMQNYEVILRKKDDNNELYMVNLDYLAPQFDSKPEFMSTLELRSPLDHDALTNKEAFKTFISIIALLESTHDNLEELYKLGVNRAKDGVEDVVMKSFKQNLKGLRTAYRIEKEAGIKHELNEQTAEELWDKQSGITHNLKVNLKGKTLVDEEIEVTYGKFWVIMRMSTGSTDYSKLRLSHLKRAFQDPFLNFKGQALKEGSLLRPLGKHDQPTVANFKKFMMDAPVDEEAKGNMLLFLKLARDRGTNVEYLKQLKMLIDHHFKA